MGMGSFVTSTEGLVKFGFILGIGLVMLAELQSNSTLSANTTANTSVGEIITGLGDFTGWVGLIVLIVVGAFLFKNLKFSGK